MLKNNKPPKVDKPPSSVAISLQSKSQRKSKFPNNAQTDTFH